MSFPLLIAHRGLVEGPDSRRENSPGQIDHALSLGFACEVDLWCIDGGLFLGHDAPVYPVDLPFLRTRDLWIHAKNVDALDRLGAAHGLRYFWHESDAYTLTSNGYVWVCPGKPLTGNGIAVMPEWHDPKFERLHASCFGICSDYVLQIRRRMEASI